MLKKKPQYDAIRIITFTGNGDIYDIREMIKNHPFYRWHKKVCKSVAKSMGGHVEQEYLSGGEAVRTKVMRRAV